MVNYLFNYFQVGKLLTYLITFNLGKKHVCISVFLKFNQCWIVISLLQLFWHHKEFRLVWNKSEYLFLTIQIWLHFLFLCLYVRGNMFYNVFRCINISAYYKSRFQKITFWNTFLYNFMLFHFSWQIQKRGFSFIVGLEGGLIFMVGGGWFIICGSWTRGVELFWTWLKSHGWLIRIPTHNIGSVI